MGPLLGQDTTLSASNEAIPKTATNVINIFVLASNFELDIEWFLTFLCCVITRIIKSKDYLNSKHPCNSFKCTCISNEYNEQRQEKCKNCPSYGQIAIHQLVNRMTKFPVGLRRKWICVVQDRYLEHSKKTRSGVVRCFSTAILKSIVYKL